MKNITLLVLQNTLQRESIIENIKDGLLSLAEREGVTIIIREMNLFSRAHAQAVDPRNDVELIIWHHLFESPIDDKVKNIQNILEYGIPVLFIRERNELYKNRDSNDKLCKRLQVSDDFYVCYMKEYLENVENILEDVIRRRRELLM